MANIGTIDFYIGVPSLPREDFEKYSTQLFDEWEAYVDQNLELSDYSLVLEVEEGSIKAKGKILATASVLYFGIAQYGSFISGLQTINNQVKAVGDYLGERASSPFDLSRVQPKLRKRGESLARLENLFVKVQRGELTVEMAMQETEAIFGAELKEAPEFYNDLKESLEKTQVFPQQMELKLVDVNGEELAIPHLPPKQPRKPQQPRNPAPAVDQFRVEVWRETKNSKRNVKVTSL
ncbi:hypothetical protein [Vibrio diazotrophicus]|uniref:hypothetical protein n=1 Tax=Vibrio diazotrophicus TaxID=685 RepID=UPI0005A7994C|nr:hypothetical protein [Vibrio diazotrophicus]